MIDSLKIKLENRLKTHDWFYEYSDDMRYWRIGSRERQEIWSIIEEFKKIGENEFDLAMDIYRKYKPKTL